MRVNHANDRLFKHLVGKKLFHVRKNLGFPEVPLTAIKAEDILIFQQYMDKLPTSHQAASAQLVRAIHKGTVVAIQTLEDSHIRLTVEFEHLGYRCSIQLLHHREQWKSMGSPRVLSVQKKLVFPLVIVSALFVLSVLGSGLWSSGVFGSGVVSLSDHEAIEMLEEHGYVVMTPQEKQELVSVAEQNGYEQAVQEKDEQVEKTTAKKDEDEQNEVDGDKAEDDDEEFIFTMKEGMTSEDLIQALKEAGIIDDERTFGLKLQDSGVATKVRPGEYVFSVHMSEDEIIEQLEN